MKSFQQYLEEDKITDERNKAIDLPGIVKHVFELKGITDSKIHKEITDYLSDKKTFSLGKMVDNFPYPAGHLKAVIEAVKSAIDEKGYGKKGSDISKPLSQAGRIDRYLKDTNKSNRLR